MKKVKLLSVLLIIGVLFAACASPEAPAAAAPAVEEPVAEAPAVEDTKYLIAYSQAELVNSWRVTNQADMEAQADVFGVDLISIDANQDPSKQLSDVENMLAQQPDCLIVSPLEFEASAPVVELATDAGIPLVIIDRKINIVPPSGMYFTEITQSHELSGELLAKKAVDLLTEKYGEPKGKVAHVQGLAGASPVIDANRGWDKVMADYPNIETVATADAGFTKEGGLKVMEDFLTTFPAGEIDIVRSDYSAMTMGAVEAIQNAGRDELKGYVLGEGGHYEAIQAVIEGYIAMETQTPPYFGEAAMKSCMAILKGEDVDPLQLVDIKVFESSDPDFAQTYLDDIRAKDLEF
jgi:ABC-type sugar transport system substrate-binding protein